ncbi:hypothetical protein PSHT_04869 [Puccinia striiformis]|uniref:Uncharacterized protein n=2 Tax=Puccinia striiformis TaxID=27350 RepID=A0A2S4WBW7_9BASI|nr:hypothetical protein PSHT_04869 [Puccinia striiformis]
MKASPLFQDPPAPPTAVPNTHAPPPPPHLQPNPYQPPTNSQFEYLVRLEPLKIKDLWFSGDANQLISFLWHIRDFLRLRSTLFQSESCKPSEHKKRPSDTKNWYNTLLIENAQQQGKVDAYGDLDGVEFQHKYLISVMAFLDRLIFIFGDRFRKEKAKRALAQCKQKNSTIEPVAGTPLPPLASQRPGAYPPQRQHRDPNAMEIDSTQMFPLTKSLLDSSRAICQAQNLCFRCLAPILPGVHTGSLNCPNPGVPNEKRQALVNCCQQNSPASVSSIQAQNPNPPLTYCQNHIPMDPSHFSSPAPPHVQPESTMDNHFQSAGFDELYEDYGEDEDETAQIPVKSVSTVQV